MNKENKNESNESVDCEKCGEEAGKKLVGDEIVIYCSECHWITNK